MNTNAQHEGHANEFAGHTPGPWIYKNVERIQDETVIYKAGMSFDVYSNGFNGDGNGRVWVAQASEITEEANARLISSAPELLAERDALRATVRAADDLCAKRFEEISHLSATVRELVAALEVTDAAMGKLGTGYALPRRCQIALANARKVLDGAA